jgi:sporulation protein YlmC with PRC-barrel domain
MTKVVHCDSCGRKVGTREDLTLNIKKGCRVEIIITCANCLKPYEKPVGGKDFNLDDLFNIFGMTK